jgi:hypothetical protein
MEHLLVSIVIKCHIPDHSTTKVLFYDVICFVGHHGQVIIGHPLAAAMSIGTHLAGWVAYIAPCATVHPQADSGVCQLASYSTEGADLTHP